MSHVAITVASMSGNAHPPAEMAGQVLPAKDLPTAADWLTAQPAVRHVESLPARVAHTSSWPHWVHPALLATLLGEHGSRPMNPGRILELSW